VAKHVVGGDNMKSGRLPRGIIFAVAVLAAVRAAPASELRYRFELLPIPPGCQSATVMHGLDERGRALGVLTYDGFATQGAVIWQGDRFEELGTFGGPDSTPYGISNNDSVVGTAETTEIYSAGYHVTRPFIWDGKSLHDLGTLGGPLGAAVALNGAGTTVGICQPAEVDPRIGRIPIRACAWEKTVVHDLGDLGGPEAWVYDINERGWIVGDSQTAELLEPAHSFPSHAFLREGAVIRDLGTLGGLESSALAVNDRGDIVGFSLTGDHLPSGFPVWHAFHWRAGVLSDLGAPSGELSWAWDVNNRGQIVGWGWVKTSSPVASRRGLLWNSGSLIDLNDVVEDASSCLITEATAIDEQGRILVNATCGGQARAAELTQVGAE
jgi:probable HAF family extracellular repeat protein